MNKKITLIPLFLFMLFAFVPALTAQTAVTELQDMKVAFWPDYDEPLVLVLLTGTLPETTPLPAEVTIPLPPDARVHAVAAVSAGGLVTIESQTVPGTVTLTTPEREFRVEYYAPYDVNGVTRSYEFSWLTDMDVPQFAAEIQQPAAATNLTSDPAAVQQITGQTDNLIYHVLPVRAVGAGLPYGISFSYDMSANVLTNPGTAQAAPPAPPAAAATAGDEGPNWLLIALGGLAALALVAGVTYYLATRSQTSRTSSKPRKPAPKRESGGGTKTAVSGVRYCHVCGTQAEVGDHYCRRCGSQLKT